MKSNRTVKTLCLCSIAIGPFFLNSTANAAPPPKPKPMNCSALAAFVKQEAGSSLNLNPFAPLPVAPQTSITAAQPVIAQIVPAASNNLAYCSVAFQLNPAITIQVGLPLNSLDGGTGGVAGGCGSTTVKNNKCVDGNWNGKIDVVGNGGYAGNVPGITSATNVGFVGSSTDNGHSRNWCNAINPQTGQPNSQPNCGIAGGGFVLDPNNNLSTEQIADFIDTSEVEQTNWATKLTQVYYAQAPQRTYWTGCSTGGRQGLELAQFHPELFDGFLVGSPAMNWNRFIIGELWPIITVADVDPADCASGTAASCAAGVSSTFVKAYTAANAKAVAQCDLQDGVADGVVNEPRRCTYDAKLLVGQTVTPMTSPMTDAQATAINMIWDGPRNQRGQRLWGGITRGTSFGTLTAPLSGSLISTYVYNWLLQDPNADIIGTINTTNFSTYFQESDIKFNDANNRNGTVEPAATDSTKLGKMFGQGGKLIQYHGANDPLIVPFGTWNFASRLFDKFGVNQTQKSYRSFIYPGNGHCGGNGAFPNAGLINATDLFNALIDWVENDNAPDSIVAHTQPNDTGNTTLICVNPNQTVYQGGPTTSASSYKCTNNQTEPTDLAIYDQTAQQYKEAP